MCIHCLALTGFFGIAGRKPGFKKKSSDRKQQRSSRISESNSRATAFSKRRFQRSPKRAAAQLEQSGPLNRQPSGPGLSQHPRAVVRLSCTSLLKLKEKSPCSGLLTKLGEKAQTPCATVGKISQHRPVRIALRHPHEHPGTFPVLKSVLPEQIAALCSENKRQQE